MSNERSLTFFTYSTPQPHGEPRWHDDGIGIEFFDSAESARRAVMELRDEIARDPDAQWRPVRIEKVQTLPLNQNNILSLLNSGVGAFVHKCEIIETIET